MKKLFKNIKNPFFTVVRKSRLENRYHPNMGRICVQVTRIKFLFLGIPYKVVHKYRETYHGEIKDCENCKISRVEKD